MPDVSKSVHESNPEKLRIRNLVLKIAFMSVLAGLITGYIAFF
jgi:hypothetical protein